MKNIIGIPASLIKSIFSVDYRALALFRMALGSIIVADLYIRCFDIAAHYTDWGLLPRFVLFEHLGRIEYWSLHFLNGSFFYQSLLFVLAFIFAVMMILGYKTRFATIMSWVFLISLQNRNPLLLQGGDVLLRVLLFWSIFLPTGSCWGLETRDNSKGKFFSAATVAVIVQVLMLYICTGFLKKGSIWETGEAVYYALSIDIFTTSLGHKLLEYPSLMTLMTHMTLILERFGVFLLLVPFAPIRLLAVLAFVGMHLGIQMTMEVGLFPWIDYASFLVFLPSSVLSVIEKRVFNWIHFIKNIPTRRIGVFYDGWIIQTFVILCLALAISWNAAGFKNLGVKLLPEARSLAYILRIDQWWSMFSPFPLKADGWYVIDGVNRSGDRVDVLNNIEHPVKFHKPEMVSKMFTSQRWRKYFLNYKQSKYAKLRLYYGKYLCRKWNESHPYQRQIMTYKLYFMEEFTQPQGAPPIEVKKLHLYSHNCWK